MIKKIFNIEVDLDKLIPNLLFLAHEKHQSLNIWPCKQDKKENVGIFEWYESITFERLKNGIYCFLWYQFIDTNNKINSGLVKILVGNKI